MNASVPNNKNCSNLSSGMDVRRWPTRHRNQCRLQSRAEISRFTPAPACIVTASHAGRPRSQFRFLATARALSPLQSLRTGYGAQPHSYSVGTKSSFHARQAAGEFETDHSADVNNEWNYTSMHHMLSCRAFCSTLLHLHEAPRPRIR
jgi:hypothetical protein